MSNTDNASEAKVPHDTGNWQSIEIYLFSNGQQYTPPRKYHLQAEELNWWEATLNHLARAHYGIQHPLIYLYTTDGHLVEGPLELKDGQAYVAVEPPEAFIDTGYQKYLIRASRSWEKRQAKKRNQACDHQQPCCVCPEKEECHLHGTCCLCPEKERAVSPEPLLPATGPQRQSPYYVSSGHGKPVPPDTFADNNGGKAAAGEHGARVGEHRPRPCEQTIHSGYEAGLDESDVTSAEHGPRGGEHRPKPCDNNRPSEYEARLDDSEVRPAEHGARSGDYVIREEEYTGRSVDREHKVDKENENKIDNSIPRSGEHKTRPTSPDKNGYLASEQRAKLTGYEAQLGEKVPWTNDVGPKFDKHVVSTDDSETSLDGSRGSRDEDAIQVTEQRPSPTNQTTDQTRYYEGEAKRGESDADDYGPEIAEHEPKIYDPGSKLSGYGSTFRQNGTKSEQRNPVSGESGLKTGDHVPITVVEGKSHRRVEKSDNIKNKPGETRPHSIVRSSRQDSEIKLDDLHTSRPDKYQNVPGEHACIPNEHDDKLGKHKRKSNEIEDKYNDPDNILGEQPEKVAEIERKESKLERGPSVVIHNCLDNDSTDDEKRLRSKGSASKLSRQFSKISSLDRKKQDSRLGVTERSDVTGGQKVELSNKDEPQRKLTDQANIPSERGAEEKDYVSSLSDPTRNETDRMRLQDGQSNGKIEHVSRTGEPKARQLKHGGRPKEEKTRKNEYACSAGETDRDSREGKTRKRLERHGGTVGEEKGRERVLNRDGKHRSEMTGHNVIRGDARARQQEHGSGASEKKSKEREYARGGDIEHGCREKEMRTIQQGHGGRASEDKGRESDVTRDGEQKSLDTSHDGRGGEVRARPQGHGIGALAEKSKERESTSRAGDTEINGREGERRARQQKHGGRVSEDRGRDYISKASEKQVGETERDGKGGDARSKQQGRIGRVSDDRGRERDVSRDGKHKTGDSDNDGKGGERRPRQRGHTSGALAETGKERESTSRAGDTERNGREGERTTRQQGHSGRASEDRGTERDYSGKVSEKRVGETERDGKRGDARPRQQGHSGRASDDKGRERDVSRDGVQRTGDTDHSSRGGDVRPKQQGHGNRTSEEVRKERENASRVSDTERHGREGELISRQQGQDRVSDERGRERDVTRDDEQRTRVVGHDSRGGEARATHQGYGSGSLEARGREREHDSKPGEQRAGETGRSSRVGVPRASKKERDGGVSDERDKEREQASKVGPKTTGETGQYDNEGEVRARQQEHGRRASEERIKYRKYTGKAGDTERDGREGEPRTSQHGYASEQRAGQTDHSGRTGDPRRGGGVSDERGKERGYAPQRSGETDHRPRRKDPRTGQNDHVAKVGTHETRVGDHEARGGDFSVRAGENGARVSSPNPRSAETSGTAPGARSSPRNKINSKARISGARLGLPAVRADEPVARSAQSNIRGNANEPTIRAGNNEARAVEPEMGGAGAARVPHISEAQQHVRRSNATEEKPTEKKRWSFGQRSTSLKKPTPFPISPLPPRISESKKPIKTNKDILPKKLSGKTPGLANETGKYNTKITPKYPSKRIVPLAVPPPTANFDQIPLKGKSTSLTKVISNHKSLLTDSGPIENAIGNNEIIVVSTNLFRNQESEITSMRLDSVKHIFDSIKDHSNEMIKIQQNIPSICANEGVQTLTELVSEAVDKHGHGVSRCKGRACTLSSQRDNMVATDDPEENFISILNKGDVVNLKLNIEVRNGSRPVDSCQKSCRKSRSLTNITRTEKCSQISFDDDMYVQSKSLQSLLNNDCFRGSGSEGRPKVLIVQCACCGRQNNSPRYDPPPCCDSKKYFVLLPNPQQQDTDQRCNCEPHCQSNSHKIHSQSQKSTSNNTVKKTYSNISLETVMVSGVPIHKREVARNVTTTNSTCQTEEPKSECLIAKHRVSITENSGIRCEIQKESYSQSQISVIAQGLGDENSCPKTCPQVCSQTSKHVDPKICSQDRSQPSHKVQSQLCPDVCPETCPLSPLNVCLQNYPQKCPQTQGRPLEQHQGCSQAGQHVQSQGSSQTCQQVQSQGCSQACPSSQSQGCSHACTSLQSQGCRQACSQRHLQICSQTAIQGGSHGFPQAKSQGHPQVCSVTCPQGFPKVCPQIYSQVQSQVCPPTCLQVQSQTCPQTSLQGFPQIRNDVSDSDTQTQWCSVLLEARLHEDGRYSFHLPPLQVLKYYSF